jgi:hypothetical protein
MTQQETFDAFMSDFRDLLRRYNAEFDMYDAGGSYYPDMRPEISFNGIYTSVGETVRPYFDFDLPQFISPDN